MLCILFNDSNDSEGAKQQHLEQGIVEDDCCSYVCNDSNGRSHKEKTENGWVTVSGNTNIIKMFDEMNEQLRARLNKFIPLSEKEKKSLSVYFKKRLDFKELKQKTNIETKKQDIILQITEVEEVVNQIEEELKNEREAKDGENSDDEEMTEEQEVQKLDGELQRVDDKLEIVRNNNINKSIENKMLEGGLTQEPEYSVIYTMPLLGTRT